MKHLTPSPAHTHSHTQMRQIFDAAATERFATPSASTSQDSGINLSIEDIKNSPDAVDKVYVTSGGRTRKKPLESGKPPYSYITLICMAISNSPGKMATLREIIEYVENRFPYYQESTKWHSSIRHNLTLNDCFVKEKRRVGDKGCPWSIDPDFDDMFDSGSLLRRRYRFKEGSKKWLKSKRDSQFRAMQSAARKAAAAVASGVPPNVQLVKPEPCDSSYLRDDSGVVPGVHPPHRFSISPPSFVAPDSTSCLPTVHSTPDPSRPAPGFCPNVTVSPDQPQQQRPAIDDRELVQMFDTLHGGYGPM
jgi:forkhead box protein E